MTAMRQASAFLGTAPPVSPLTEVEAMRRNALGQHWMAPQWRSPEKRQYEACERNLSREFKLLGKSAGHTMERFDYEKWRRRSLPLSITHRDRQEARKASAIRLAVFSRGECPQSTGCR